MLNNSLDLSVYRNVCFHIFQYPLDIELNVKSPASPSGAVWWPIPIREIRSLDVVLYCTDLYEYINVFELYVNFYFMLLYFESHDIHLLDYSLSFATF